LYFNGKKYKFFTSGKISDNHGCVFDSDTLKAGGVNKSSALKKNKGKNFYKTATSIMHNPKMGV
jgi:hypothetical protein